MLFHSQMQMESRLGIAERQLLWKRISICWYISFNHDFKNYLHFSNSVSSLYHTCDCYGTQFCSSSILAIYRILDHYVVGLPPFTIWTLTVQNIGLPHCQITILFVLRAWSQFWWKYGFAVCIGYTPRNTACFFYSRIFYFNRH